MSDTDTTRHPGEMLREKMKGRGLDIHFFQARQDLDLYRGLEAIKKHLADITPNIADALADIIGIPAEEWLDAQRRFDEAPVVEQLGCVVRGEWEPANKPGSLGYRSPIGGWHYSDLAYYVFSTIDDHDEWHAMVDYGDIPLSLNIVTDSPHDTPLAALRALIREWGDEIRQFAGTFHPEEVSGE